MHPDAAAPPARRRLSAWWFALPATLLVVAVATFVVLLVLTLRTSLATDAEIPLDGQPYVVSVPADDVRSVFVDTSATEATCRFRDDATGEELPVRPTTGTFTRSTGQGEWTARWDIETGSGQIEVTCVGDADANPVQLAPPVQVGRFVGSILATILVPLALGALALVSLIVVTVLYATSRTRPQRR